MENTRIKNSARNIFFGLIKYSVTIIFPFLIRTILIIKLGTDYAGISSLFSSVLQVLSLSELGFSTAVVFALYEPVANNDTERICNLLAFFRSAYRYCGFVILFLGLCICPFINNFISGSYPSEINIYIIFILLLINTSVSYLFCGYKSVLFSANQRDDILSKCIIFSNLILYFIQILSLVVFVNYYIYIVSITLGTIINNVLLNYYSNKMYPLIRCNGKIERNEKQKLFKSIGTLFGHQLDMVVITSADNIVISMFLGLTTLTIYSNYYYVLNSLLSILIMISNSFAGSIGNSIAVETKDKNYHNFIDFTYLIGMLSAICTILMFGLYQDFMIIWMGETMLLETSIVFYLCLSFYSRQFRRSIVTYKIAAGIWDKDALKPYVSAIVNVVLNLLLVRIIGLSGVIISTIISMLLIEAPWEIIVFFKEYFNKGMRKYLVVQFVIILKMFVLGFIIIFISNYINGYGIIRFFIKAVILGIITLILFSITSYKDDEFQYIIRKLFNVIRI